jgi:dTDP-glucose 4,6-dehydratase
MKVLVTGGAGFIGSALCRHLVGDLGLQVLNVDCLTYAADLRSLDAVRNRKTYRFLQADICDGEVIEAACVEAGDGERGHGGRGAVDR